MSVRVKQKNPGWLKKLSRKYRQDYAIAVGFPASRKSIEYPDGTPVVTVALANNFGVASKNIPARPFMSIAKQPAEKAIKKPIRKLTHKLNMCEITKKRMAEVVAPVVEAQFKKTIVNLREPPNSPATIRAKKSDNPLIDTGLLVASLKTEVRKMKKGGGA